MSYSYDAKEIIGNLTKEDIIRIISSFNVNYHINSNNTVSFNAICHSNINSSEFKSHTHNLIYYDDTKTFICFSGCNRKAYNIITLIIEIFETQYFQELSFYESIKYIAEFFNLGKKEIHYNIDAYCDELNINTQIREIKNGWGSLPMFSSIAQKDIQQENYEEIRLQRTLEEELWMEKGEIPYLIEYNKQGLYTYYEDFSKVNTFNHLWTNEGINFNTMHKYEIRFDNANKEIIIPQYDHRHRLVGVRSRLLKQDMIERQGKYRPTYFKSLCLSHPTSQILYGLDKVINEIQRTKKVIVFEGEKSCLKLNSALNTNDYLNIGVAVCGSSISATHMKILKNLGVENVYIAFDKEFEQPKNDLNIYHPTNAIYLDKYEEYIQKRNNLIEKVNKYFNVYFLQDSIKNPLLSYKDSPIDKGLEVLYTLMQSSICFKQGECNEF